MTIAGTVSVVCPACRRSQMVALVQSINTRRDPAIEQRLLRGELNVLACECGKRTALEATLLFHDPDASYSCQVCPGGEEAMARGSAAFAASGVAGARRLVPSTNALVEKVVILRAGLDDRAVEMAKVLLLASLGEGELERVLLFASVDREGGLVGWILFDDTGREPRRQTSSLAAYERLAERLATMPSSQDERIDRAWAVNAVQAMVDPARTS